MDDVKWLIAREIPRLRRYALSLAGDEQEADDLVQDCLERALRKRHLWKRHGSIRSWLYRVLYNVFVNQVARRQRDRRQVPLDEAPAPVAEPPRQEHRIACREIGEAMACLPPDQRAAIVLTAVDGLPYEEVAAILDIPIGTLRSRLSRGREALREFHDVDAGSGDRLGRVRLQRVK